eukprot:766927-Hanusia_phi.AAC.1
MGDDPVLGERGGQSPFGGCKGCQESIRLQQPPPPKQLKSTPTLLLPLNYPHISYSIDDPTPAQSGHGVNVWCIGQGRYRRGRGRIRGIRQAYFPPAPNPPLLPSSIPYLPPIGFPPLHLFAHPQACKIHPRIPDCSRPQATPAFPLPASSSLVPAMQTEEDKAYVIPVQPADLVYDTDNKLRMPSGSNVAAIYPLDMMRDT